VALTKLPNAGISFMTVIVIKIKAKTRITAYKTVSTAIPFIQPGPLKKSLSIICLPTSQNKAMAKSTRMSKIINHINLPVILPFMLILGTVKDL
jgi:hypothetical protein